MRMKKSSKKYSFRCLKKRLAFAFVKGMSASASIPEKRKRHHAIRVAAYASMACAIGPRKAWSRAILSHIIRNRKPIIKHHRNREFPTERSLNDGLGIGEELNHLSEVVPGGTAMDSLKLLNETGHYIKCLRAQLQIMRNILHSSST